MKQRSLYWLALLLLAGLFLAACQAPAPVEEASRPVQPTAQTEAKAAVVSPTATPEPPTDTPVPDPSSTKAVSENPAPDGTSPEVDSASEGPPAGEESPNPLAADPDRPGFTLDGSPSLGDGEAPIVIVDFSDFQ